MGQVVSAAREAPECVAAKNAFQQYAVEDVWKVYGLCLRVCHERLARMKAAKARARMLRDQAAKVAGIVEDDPITAEATKKTRAASVVARSKGAPVVPLAPAPRKLAPGKASIDSDLVEHCEPLRDGVIDADESFLLEEEESQLESLFRVPLYASDFVAVFGPGNTGRIETSTTQLPLSIFHLFDVDGTGQIPALEMFFALALYSTGPLRERVAFCYLTFDDDGNGMMDKAEMRVLLGTAVASLFKLGDLKQVPTANILQRAVDDLFESLDKSGDGMLDFDEFFTWAQNSNHASSLMGKFDRIEAVIKRERIEEKRKKQIVWKSTPVEHPILWGHTLPVERVEVTYNLEGTEFEDAWRRLKTISEEINEAERIAPDAVSKFKAQLEDVVDTASLLGLGAAPSPVSPGDGSGPVSDSSFFSLTAVPQRGETRASSPPRRSVSPLGRGTGSGTANGGVRLTKHQILKQFEGEVRRAAAALGITLGVEKPKKPVAADEDGDVGSQNRGDRTRNRGRRRSRTPSPTRSAKTTGLRNKASRPVDEKGRPAVHWTADLPGGSRSTGSTTPHVRGGSSASATQRTRAQPSLKPAPTDSRPTPAGRSSSSKARSPSSNRAQHRQSLELGSSSRAWEPPNPSPKTAGERLKSPIQLLRRARRGEPTAANPARGTPSHQAHSATSSGAALSAFERDPELPSQVLFPPRPNSPRAAHRSALSSIKGLPSLAATVEMERLYRDPTLLSKLPETVNSPLGALRPDYSKAPGFFAYRSPASRSGAVAMTAQALKGVHRTTATPSGKSISGKRLLKKQHSSPSLFSSPSVEARIRLQASIVDPRAATGGEKPVVSLYSPLGRTAPAGFGRTDGALRSHAWGTSGAPVSPPHATSTFRSPKGASTRPLMPLNTRSPPGTPTSVTRQLLSGRAVLPSNPGAELATVHRTDLAAAAAAVLRETGAPEPASPTDITGFAGPGWAKTNKGPSRSSALQSRGAGTHRPKSASPCRDAVRSNSPASSSRSDVEDSDTPASVQGTPPRPKDSRERPGSSPGVRRPSPLHDESRNYKGLSGGPLTDVEPRQGGSGAAGGGGSALLPGWELVDSGCRRRRSSCSACTPTELWTEGRRPSASPAPQTYASDADADAGQSHDTSLPLSG